LGTLILPKRTTGTSALYLGQYLFLPERLSWFC